MSRRRFMILLATLVALNAFFWLAGGGLALGRGIIGQFFGPRLIRAEVFVQAPSGPQDWLIDRGVITALATTPTPTVTLREADGRIVQIPYAATAPLQGAPRLARSGRLRIGERVVLYRQANSPAELVQVEGVGQ